MELSVIVVTYNNLDTINQCLESIRRYIRGLSFEVILIDNCSTDGTYDAVVREYPWVESYQSATNEGFAAANNRGICESEGRFILLLNPDAFLVSYGIDHALDFMENSADTAILGGKIIYPNGEMQTSNNAFPSLFTEVLHMIGISRITRNSRLRAVWGRYLGRFLGRSVNEYLRVYWDSDRVRAVDWVSGASMLVRREAVEDVGLLDDHFFMYYEDADWCLRMTQKGWKVVYSPDMTVVHQVGGEARRSHPLAELERNRSRLYYYNKHFPIFHRVILRILLIGSILMQMLCSLLSPVDRLKFAAVLKLALSHPLIP
jgi:GT2 family glycosyltransferase